MNQKMLSKLKYKNVRIRPIACRFDVAGRLLDRSDRLWFVKDASSDGLTIQNPFGHMLTLARDQIHDYRSDPSGKSDGFLMLHGKPWVKRREVGVEPSLRSHHAR